jgi:glutamate-1-semialdehyde aminotransferase
MAVSPGCFALGAADPDVNAAVHDAVERGSFSTLNAPEEVELAELLLELHPWCKDGMVRYARGGGEVNSIAVRIARAFTGRDVVAFCGYHGWCDWYLAANVTSKGETTDGITGHQLTGLDPAGVPKGLGGTNLGWRYGRIDELKNILHSNAGNVAAIVMEVARSDDPPPGFLEEIRQLATDNNVVLVFDEVSAAWREVLGGRHLKYGVSPDICMFSKTMSNGFAMGAVIGRRKVMQAAQKTFISSTYWTERIGPTAALATIKKFKRCNVQAHLMAMGKKCKEGWGRCAQKHGLHVNVGGFDAWPCFTFDYAAEFGEEVTAILATLFTQEMLDRGFLATGSNVMTYAHKQEHMDLYLAAVDQVFGLLAKWLAETKTKQHCRTLAQHLKGPVKHRGFERLVS